MTRPEAVSLGAASTSLMPSKHEPDAKDMEKAERDIGANIPQGMKGEDDGDASMGEEKP